MEMYPIPALICETEYCNFTSRCFDTFAQSGWVELLIGGLVDEILDFKYFYDPLMRKQFLYHIYKTKQNFKNP